MPENSVRMKVEATRAYGAESSLQCDLRDPRHGRARDRRQDRSLRDPPFDDERIIAGQGTIGLEILEEWPDVTTSVTPSAEAASWPEPPSRRTSIDAGIDVFGVEPCRRQRGDSRFTPAGRDHRPPNTIADGARTLAIGERNFAIIRERVKDVRQRRRRHPPRDHQVGHVTHEAVTADSERWASRRW